MFMSSKFKAMVDGTGALELTRAGVVKQIILPLEHQKLISYDANVDENNNIVLTSGNSIYILADEFGFLGGTDESTQVDANIFFIDDGVVLELIEGKVLLKDENGLAYSIDETGDIDYPRSNARIHWATEKDIRGIVATVAKFKYTISPEETQKYIDNLVISMTLNYLNTSHGYMFHTQVVQYYEDLGLGIFQFINYSDRTYTASETDDHIDVADLEDIEEDEEEDEEDYKMDGEDDFEEKF
jgi:hypothetical protein